MTKQHQKNGVFDQGKNKNTIMEIKWIDRKYPVQDHYDVAHQDVKMYRNTNQFLALPFFSHYKPHGARELSNYYHLRFDPKIGNIVCETCRIQCACVPWTSMLDKTWISDVPSYEKERYKPVTKCNYGPVLGYLNNWNIIQLSQKSIPSDAFDEINEVVVTE